MSFFNEKLQNFYKLYMEELGRDESQVTTSEVASWIIEKELWKPARKELVEQLSDLLANAWREEYRTDKYNRRYRAKHAVRTKDAQGHQTTLWADIDVAPRPHMEMAFAQRRKQIVGDCLQLKTDVDVYNDLRRNEPPIQMPLDFTKDIAELQAGKGPRSANDDEFGAAA